MIVQLPNRTITVTYRSTSIGDEVYDYELERTYIATIVNADDLNWIVISSTPNDYFNK